MLIKTKLRGNSSILNPILLQENYFISENGLFYGKAVVSFLMFYETTRGQYVYLRNYAFDFNVTLLCLKRLRLFIRSQAIPVSSLSLV